MFLNFLREKVDNRGRILTLDLLRGVFLLEIIANHLAWSPSLFTYIGGGSRLPASAAEGFFAISGVLVGYLYGPKILKNTRDVFKKIWKRAFLLYFLAVFFTLLFTAWASLEPDSVKYSMTYGGGPLRFLFEVFTLQHTFGWADFLNRYALFMLIAPFAIWLIAKGKTWIVIGGSFTIWLLLRRDDLFLPFSAWQLIFMLGIVIGYYLPQLEKRFYDFSKKTQRILFVSICSTAFLSYVISIIYFVALPIAHPHDVPLIDTGRGLIQDYFNKEQLSPGRIFVGTLWFTALYMAFRRYEKVISQYTLGVLEVLGKQSLFVYGLHALVLFFIDMYLAPPPGNTKTTNTIVTIIVIGFIYAITYYRGHITRAGKRILSRKSTTQVP